MFYGLKFNIKPQLVDSMYVDALFLAASFIFHTHYTQWVWYSRLCSPANFINELPPIETMPCLI